MKRTDLQLAHIGPGVKKLRPATLSIKSQVLAQKEKKRYSHILVMRDLLRELIYLTSCKSMALARLWLKQFMDGSIIARKVELDKITSD